jgi:hypothetical protein
LPRRKKIARASPEARAKPSPYEDRRRGHRDPREARIVIVQADASSGGPRRRRYPVPRTRSAHIRYPTLSSVLKHPLIKSRFRARTTKPNNPLIYKGNFSETRRYSTSAGP